jgi:hypothetical protein
MLLGGCSSLKRRVVMGSAMPALTIEELRQGNRGRLAAPRPMLTALLPTWRRPAAGSFSTALDPGCDELCREHE